MIYLFLFLAFIIRLLVAHSFYGTYDVQTAYIIADLLKHGSLIYDATVRSNMPPTYFYIVSLVSFLADKTHLPLSFWIKVPFSLADLGIGSLIYKMAKDLRKTEKTSLFFSGLYLFNPLPILIFGFQGQIDSLFMFFVLAAYLVIRDTSKINPPRIFISGLILGLASTVKLVPLIFIPLFLITLCQSGFKKGWKFKKMILILTSFVLLTVLPLFAEFFPYRQVLSGIVEHVVYYKTAWGIWGVSQVLARLGDFLSQDTYFLPFLIFLSKKQTLSILLVAVVSYVLIFWHRLSLLRGILLIFISEMAISSFLANQYLVWFLPFFIVNMLASRKKMVYQLLIFSLLAFLGNAAIYKYWDDPNFYLPLANWAGALDLNRFFVNLYSLIMLPAWLISLGWFFKLGFGHDKIEA